MSETRLILIRHGQTAWNAQGRVQGGGSLDALGKEQAQKLAARLVTEPISHIYSSPALRAKQTARATANVLGLNIHQSSLLKDLDYGRFAGAFIQDVQKEAPGLFEQWRDSPETVTFENGENLGNLRRRINKFIANINKFHPGGTILAATHDSPIRIAASIALGLPDSEHKQDYLKAPLASVTSILIKADSAVLEIFRDTAHLQGINA
ncbi:MAG: histidine phosphatase family protein [SAR202 cluster bacterium]|nr:histidine phosphatase family protein [SAR202 cluster bacterium]|tara:strand:- start:667 stop:1290 length:624 start_codon:yes stop_codon:yes gene_type:complete